MKHLSTKDISALWGISPRRVALLAAQGRIEGAKLVANRWLIPEYAAKPADSRRYQSAPENPAERYVFPFLLYCVSEDEDLEHYASEEQALYRLCMLFEAGDFENARQAAGKLLSAVNCYVRIGALYFLSIVSLYLQNFEDTENYAALFRTACLEAPGHKAELSLLLCEFNSEISSVTDFSNEVDFSDIDAFPDDHLAMISDLKFLSELVKFSAGGKKPDILSYEIFCRQAERQNYYYCAMLMHYNLSMYYALVHDTGREFRHMRQAIDIGLKHGTVFTLAYSVFLNPETACEILQEYPSEIADRFAEFNKRFTCARNAYAEYLGDRSQIPYPTDNELLLISSCLKKHTVDEMAKEFHLSYSGMKKRLSALYSKLGVKNKNEMLQIAVRSFMDIKKDSSV